MKTIRYVLIGMSILGIIASIGNMVYDKSFSHIKTIGISFVTIAIAINFDKIIEYLESQESTNK